MIARCNQPADVESQAKVIADNAGAGLAFGDKQVVDEIFRALRVPPSIDMVCVYDKGAPSSAVFSAKGSPAPILAG